jgi:hypothetical protein
MPHGKHQRNVDVDALGDERFDGGYPDDGRRDFDHQVRPIHFPPQSPRLLDRPFGASRSIGRDLDADEAVSAVGCVEHRSKNVGRHLDVLDGEPFEECRGSDFGVRGDGRAKPVVVFGARGDGFREDRGIAGHASNPILFDQPAELAADDEIAPNEIEPDRLAAVFQSLQPIGSARGPHGSPRTHVSNGAALRGRAPATAGSCSAASRARV